MIAHEVQLGDEPSRRGLYDNVRHQRHVVVGRRMLRPDAEHAEQRVPAAQHTAQASTRCRERVEGGELLNGCAPEVRLAEGVTYAQLRRAQVGQRLQVVSYGFVSAAAGKE